MEPPGSPFTTSVASEKRKPYAFGLRGSPLPAKATAVDKRGTTPSATSPPNEAASADGSGAEAQAKPETRPLGPGAGLMHLGGNHVSRDGIGHLFRV